MDPNSINWVSVSELYDPEEAYLVIGLLEAAGIPVKVERESVGELFGLTIGPLARIVIFVPGERKSEADKFLEGYLDKLETDDN